MTYNPYAANQSAPPPPDNGSEPVENPYAANAVPQITPPPPVPHTTDPTLDINPQFQVPTVKSVPQNWDYKNAKVGPHGEALPDGAKGWTPFGTPYFGEGVAAKWNEYKWRFSDRVTNAPSEQDWMDYYKKFGGMYQDAVKEGGDISWIESAKIGGQAALEGLDLLGKQLGSASENAGVLTPVTQGLRVGVEAVFDLLQQAAYGLERGAGAVKSAFNEMAEIRAEQKNPFDGMSHEGDAVQENELKRIGNALEEGWQSGRILYSSVFDKSREAEFLRRYRAGEDPALLAMELQNPIVEAIGQTIFDPLNFVGAIAKAGKWAGLLDDAADAVKATGVLADAKHAAIIDEVVNVGSDALAAEKKLELANAQIKAVDTIRNGKLLKQTYSPFSLASSSRSEVLLKKSADYVGVITGNMFQMGMSGDEVVDFFRYGIMSVSKSVDEVQRGLEGILKLPGGRTALSEQGVQTFAVMRDLLTAEDGAVNFNRLKKLSEAKDFKTFAQEAATLLSSATSKQFPSIVDMRKAYEKAVGAEKKGLTVTEGTKKLSDQYKKLRAQNPAAVYFSKMIEGPEKVKKAINTGLGTFYFSLQGGVAAKNWLNNTETILIDLGKGAFKHDFFKEGKFWNTQAYLDDLDAWVGFRPTSAVGFTSQVTSEGAKAFGFGKYMQSGEEASAVRATAAAFETGMRKLLKPILKDTKELKAAGFTDSQVKHLQKIFFSQKGDKEKILSEFRRVFGTEMTEEWRMLDFVKEAHQKGFDEIGLTRELEDISATAKTPNEVRARFEKLRKSVAERAKFVNKDVPGVSSPEAGDIIAMLQEAVDNGDLDNAANVVLSTAIEASYRARDEYLSAINSFFKKYKNSPELQPLLQQWSEVQTKFIQGGAGVSKMNKDMMNGVRALSDNLADIKNPDYLQLWEQWGFGERIGNPPADLDFKSLKNAIWEDGRRQVAANWETYFGSIFADSEDIINAAQKFAPQDEIVVMFEKSRKSAAQAEAYRSAVYVNGELRVPKSLEVRQLAKDYGIPSVSPKGKPLDNTILKIINENAATVYNTIDEVPPEEALKAFEQWRVAKGRPEATLTKFVSIPPAYPNGSTPSVARAWYESGEFITRALDDTEAEIIKRWGKMIPSGFDDIQEASLKSFVNKAIPKVDEAKVFALKAAEYWRDFILHDYGKRTYADLATSYILPYQFWYSRSYANWMKRVVTDPQIIAGYARYKDAMAQLHSDMPEWYRYNISTKDIGDLLGIDVEHPLFFNLEAALNPLYGITSPDFNDPAKRFDAASRTMDDIGKFGPSVWAPLQIGMAVYASAVGEQDAASRWGGRLIPETALIKGVSSYFGKSLELDPNVWIFGQGMDAYERNRIGRAAAELVQMGYSEEEVFDAVQSQKGPLWDLAYQNATKQRAPAQMGSWLLGVGFKARTETDVKIDQMYTDIGALFSNAENMPPDQYRQAWDELRNMYPFMDMVLMSRKSGDMRDAAYAYNVLGRVPPGDLSSMFELVGIDQARVDAFYSSKGKMDNWGQGEKEHFMGGVAMLAAVLRMPSNATRAEWNQTKTMYKTVEEEVSKQLDMPYSGDYRGIWDIVQTYYDLLETDKQAAEDLKQLYPIQEALNMKRAYIANNPELYKYYGSLDTLESYYYSKARADLTKRFGEDIYDLSAQYYFLKDNYAFSGKPEDKATFEQFKKANEAKLKKFWASQDEYDAWVDKAVVTIGSKMPEKQPLELRANAMPTETQKYLAQQINAPQGVQAQEILAHKQMRPEIVELVQLYISGQGELPSVATRRLDYIARDLGITVAELLQILGVYFTQAQ